MLHSIYELFVGFGRASLLGFGGGPSTIPLIQIEVVRNFKWMTTEEFTDVFGMANALPGPIATKMAGYIGYKVAGWPGAFSALTGAVMPTFLAMVGLYYLLGRFKTVPQLAGAIKAVRPVVIVLLVSLIIDMWPKAITGWATAGIGVLAFVLLQVAHVHPALIIVGALAIGAFLIR
jgi:chromate transporter